MSHSALVLGGGFAGLEAAVQLRNQGFEVTLVSNRSFLFVYPTSIWVVTGELRLEDVCLDLADAARRHGFRFVEGAVSAISGARRTATVNGEELTADHLFVAIGGVPLRPAGVEHTFSVAGAPDGGVRTKAALDALVAKRTGRIAMGFGGNPKDPSAVRGGPVFEVLFNVEKLLRRRGVRDAFTLTFFAPMASPGERMGRSAVAAIGKMLARRGIAMRVGQRIAAFEHDGVVFEDGSTLASDLTLFVPAGEGHPVLRASDLPLNDAGFVQIDEGCAVPGLQRVWAIGDAAALAGPAWRAKQGHLAEVTARVAARNAGAVAAGRPERESYLPHVGILCLLDTGDGAAWVQRDALRERLVPLPIVGHWMKRGWGTCFNASKRRQVPRLPGM